MIGGDVSTDHWFSNPMYFAGAAHSRVLVYGAVAEAASKAKKLAVLFCAEVQDCSNVAGWVKEGARDAGVEVVYEAKISLAQPDYTAECLQARNRGADAIFEAADPNTMGRLASSCSRQSYRPLYINTHVLQDANMSKLDGIEGGMVGTQGVAPWFLTDETPGIRAYRTAIQKYAPQAKPAQSVVIGWAAGKLFESAVGRLGSTADRLTSAETLRGLWQIKDETLGGLSVPITFGENQRPTIGRCWFADAVVDGRWVAPHGATPACTDHKFN